jgi:D-lyxose ketol-isomerase
MEELQKAQKIAVLGPRREEILADYQRILDAWAMKMPPVEPLVLDFGLNRFEEVGLVEAWICNEERAGYCGKYLFLFDGQTCPEHRHRLKTETFFLAKGALDVCLDGTRQRLTEGDTLLIEPWLPHSMTGVGPALILEISTPCLVDDNYFADPAIPIGGNYGGGAL